MLTLSNEGMRAPTIARVLRAEGVRASRRGILKFLTRYKNTQTIARQPGSGRKTIITEDIQHIVEERMREDDETTAMQLHQLLTSHGYNLSRRTVLRCRTGLGWTFRGSAYCQLIRAANKEKRLQWAERYLSEALDGFSDVIWTDECSIQMESHRRFCCRKRGEPPRNKPRPKHPAKVHVWAGISVRGPTPICIFEGTMDADLYIEILEQSLLPFIRTVYPTSHRFMQDNDPKHTSRKAQAFFLEKRINWWKTPAESPDCNPIENLWHELKEYIRREAKPKTKQELIDGINTFWSSVDAAKCTRYIRHLRKVLPKVIELKGEATGY